MKLKYHCHPLRNIHQIKWEKRKKIQMLTRKDIDSTFISPTKSHLEITGDMCSRTEKKKKEGGGLEQMN